MALSRVEKENRSRKMAMNRVLVVVVRDIMAARITLPVIMKLRGLGFEIVVIAEGKAIGIIEAAGLSIAERGDDTMTSFAAAKGDPKARLSQLKPAFVWVGTSSPANWEIEIGLAAQALGIPVVAVSDIWGGLSRLRPPLVPDLALVIDEDEATRVVAEGKAKAARVIGDIASANARVPHTREARELRELCTEQETVLIVPDAPANVLEIVEFTVRSIELSARREFTVIPRLIHPKVADYPGVSEIVVDANALLSRVNVRYFNEIGVDAIAVRARYTVTSYSTPGRIAVHNRRRSISVQGPVSKALLQEETGSDEFPLVRIGAVAEMREPRAIDGFAWPQIEDTAQAWASGARYDPLRAIAALKEFKLI